MDVQFVDRILICSDCHGEFVFTAGEQLFFHDKQFKNDPKRCKPCKSRRSGLAAAANGGGPAAAGLSRTETRTECSECGVQTTVPFKPTQGRPVLCRQCFQVRNKGAAVTPSIVAPPVQAPVPVVVSTATPEATASALAAASAEPSGAVMSADSALVAAATMAAASPESSVASVADLASIAEVEEAEHVSAISAVSQIPPELLAAASSDMLPPEISVRAEASEA
jgi:CxxC-x17-CxxC domain-containing protein